MKPVIEVAHPKCKPPETGFLNFIKSNQEFHNHTGSFRMRPW